MYNYCKSCRHDDGDIGFCDKCFYNHILEEKGIPPTEYEAKPKSITNADRIRAMTDEELSVFCSRICDTYYRTHQFWLDWLRQEAEEGE